MVKSRLECTWKNLCQEAIDLQQNCGKKLNFNNNYSQMRPIFKDSYETTLVPLQDLKARFTLTIIIVCNGKFQYLH